MCRGMSRKIIARVVEGVMGVLIGGGGRLGWFFCLCLLCFGLAFCPGHRCGGVGWLRINAIREQGVLSLVEELPQGFIVDLICGGGWVVLFLLGSAGLLGGAACGCLPSAR